MNSTEPKDITTVVNRYFTIDLWGIEHAYEKYCDLETACLAGVVWMEQHRHRRIRRLAVNLRFWMVAPSGFTCPHTPYWLCLRETEWEAFSMALRKGGEPTFLYDMCRNYGSWGSNHG